ncbi:hypothetical protein C4588_08075 [Candidatus Parcubacteria bacterium]|nr:MAG: hypothetical protein C4588_08075 [Candidatus Parcubacteria bacterium]
MLRFDFNWDTRTARGDINDATSGELTICLSDAQIWSKLRWSWHDLLEFLCTNWGKLLNEGAISVDASESIKYDFAISHDLAYALRGASPPPSIILTRKGLVIEVATSNKVALIPFNGAVTSLKYAGNLIAKRLIGNKDPKSNILLKKWKDLTGFEEVPACREARNNTVSSYTRKKTNNRPKYI